MNQAQNQATLTGTFQDRLSQAQHDHASTLAIGLAPTLNKLPYEIQRYDDPFLPFGRAVIEATGDLVCAYVFHLGAYLALGAAGAVALERTIAYVPSNVIKVLHGPFATDEYVRAAFEDGFGADAVTLTQRCNLDSYLSDAAHGVYVADGPLAEDRPRVGTYQRTDKQIDEQTDADKFYQTCRLPGSLVFYWHSVVFQGNDFRELLRRRADALRRGPDGLDGR